MEANMAARRERAKLEKKNKKKRKLEEAEAAVKEAEEGLPPIKLEKQAEEGIVAALKEFRQTTDGSGKSEGKTKVKEKSVELDTSKGKQSKHGKAKSSVQEDPTK